VYNLNQKIQINLTRPKDLFGRLAISSHPKPSTLHPKPQTLYLTRPKDLFGRLAISTHPLVILAKPAIVHGWECLHLHATQLVGHL
jgi:hypothetical protein